MNDAEVGDIYVDANSKLWRITSVYREPTVEAEEIEGTLYDPNRQPPYLTQAAAQGINLQSTLAPAVARIDKRIQRGFTGLPIWNGWRRIWRREPTTTAAT